MTILDLVGIILILHLLVYLSTYKEMGDACRLVMCFFAGMYCQKNISVAVLTFSFSQDHDLKSRKCLTVFCLSYGDKFHCRTFYFDRCL